MSMLQNIARGPALRAHVAQRGRADPPAPPMQPRMPEEESTQISLRAFGFSSIGSNETDQVVERSCLVRGYG